MDTGVERQVDKAEAVQENIVSQLIGLYEDLRGQAQLKPAFNQLLNQDSGMVNEYFTIFNAFKEKKSPTPDDFILINQQFNDFFNKQGIDFKSSLNNPENINLNTVHNQTAYYLLAYTYFNFNVNANGVIITKPPAPKTFDWQQNQIKTLLENLESVHFTPAFYMHSKLNMDAEEARRILLQGANLNKLECQYGLARIYLSHLAGTISQDPPPAFDFPEGVNEEKLIQWMNNAREKGYDAGLANMRNYISNVAGALGSMHQQNVSPDQKKRLLQMAEIAKKISGDEVINKKLDKIIHLGDKGEDYNTIKANFKKIVKTIDAYLVADYSNRFSMTPEKINSSLTGMLLERLHTEMHIEQKRLENRYPSTAKVFTYPIKHIQRLREDLENKDDPRKVLQETKELVDKLKDNVINEERISHPFKNFLNKIEQKIKDFSSIAFHVPTKRPLFITTAVNQMLNITKSVDSMMHKEKTASETVLENDTSKQSKKFKK